MKKKKLYILSPCDRFNYGDLMFNYILENVFKEDDIELIYCAFSESDLSSLGGKPTFSYEVLYSLDNEYDNYVIIGGGESLCASWESIMASSCHHLKSLRDYIYKLKYLGPYLAWTIIKLLKLVTPRKTRFPYSIGKHELNNIKSVLYNSVGGDCVKNLDQQSIDIIKDNDYLAVRDILTHDNLKGMGIPSIVVPDSVIILSDIFTDDFWDNMVSTQVKSLFYSELKNKAYIYFQINMNLWYANKANVISEIQHIINDDLYEIVLCPIGTASHHMDQVAMKDIHTIFPVCHYIVDPSVFDIAFLINKASLYIGSSLHGIITSMSYNIPFLSFGNRKAYNYIKTWDAQNLSIHVCDISNIHLHYRRAIEQKYNPSSQKEQYYKSLSSLKSPIINS